MNGPGTSVESRCDECGTRLHPGQGGPVCVRCALAHALVPALRGGPEPLTQQRSVVGDYELLEELGRGGMGVVYKAHQKSLGRTVAVKMLLAGRLANEEFVSRFRGEASAAAVLRHPNIVAIHEVGCEEGQHYFSMDYVSGRTLAEITRDGPLPARRAAAYVRTLAVAMQHAHQHGIMHRDLKPSNVLIDAGDQPHITDFGLAKEITAEIGLTVTGQVLGSPGYMPPEQADGSRGKTGPQSDVYGLGATLYHLLTGRPPFIGQDYSETLRLLLMTDPVTIRPLNPAVPVDLETICLKCLEKEPARRYTSAEALAEDLRRFLAGEPVLARPIGAVGRLRRWCGRKPLVAALAAAVGTSIALGFAGIGWQLRQHQRAAADARTQRNEARAQRDIAQGRLYAVQMRLAQADCLAGRTGGHEQGRLTGRFIGPRWNVWVNRQAIALTPDDVLRDNALNEARGFAATGRTTVHNMATSARAMSVLISLAREGLLPLRVREFYSGFSASDKEFARSVSGVDEDWYRVIGAKYFLDGTPFKGDASYVGIPHSGPVLMSPAELQAAIEDAVAHGEQPAFHSSGQLSGRAVLDAIEAVGPAATRIRVRLEHQDIAFPEDLARIADDGVFVSMQPAHFGVFSPPIVPPEAYLPFDWYLFRSYIDAGATVILGSDMSAPPTVQLAMATLGPTPWNLVEAMTFDEALKAMTADAAAGARGDEHHLGVLRAGKLADFVVVSTDPSTMPPPALFGLQVLRTVVGGRTVFAAQ